VLRWHIKKNSEQIMKLSMIVAMADNGVIGINNQLPWHLPEDLRYFKQVTMAKPIIMGRKTFASIGRALPGRLNIVISRQAELSLPEGVAHVPSLDAAVTLASSTDAAEAMIIGGAEIYRQAAAIADCLYLTKVHADVDGDAFFDAFDAANWQLRDEIKHQASGDNPYDYSFCVYERNPKK
jgi:dihydrofolate reductase